MPANIYFNRGGCGTTPAFVAIFSGLNPIKKVPLAMVSLPEFFSSLQVQLVTGIVILSLLLITAIVFFLRYRRKFLIFFKKCSDFQSELGKTRRELAGTQSRLMQTASQHREILNGAGAAIFKLSEQGECVYANSALCELIGVRDSDLLENGLINAVHPDDREEMSAAWKGFADREAPFEFSYRFQRKDGGIVHVMERGSRLLDKQQQVSGYFAQVMDASGPLLAAQAARRAEQQSDWFIEKTSDGFYKLTLDEPLDLNTSEDQLVEQIARTARLTVCSSDLAAFFGKSAQKLIGTPFNELPGGCGFFEKPSDIRRFIDSAFRICNAEGVRDDSRGTPVCLSYQTMGIIEKDRLVAIWGTQRDITRRKREQEEARQREELLRRTLNCLPGEVSVKDPSCRYLYVNKAFEKRTGIPQDDWIGKTVFELLPAAPRDINKMSIQAMKTGEICRQVLDRTDNGQQNWVEMFQSPLVSSDDVVEGVVGISMDVTDRTLQELALQSSEARFRGLVENSPDAVMLSEAGSRKVTYANPAFCDLFGYTGDEVTGLKVDDLHSPGSRRQVLEQWDEHARQSQHFNEVLACLRKDRSTVFADVGVALGLFDRTEQVVAVYRDAAARKKIESELERQRDRQAALLNSASVLVVSVDNRGVIRSANDAVLELLGLNESDLVGKPYAETLVCEKDRAVIEEAFIDPQPGFQTDCEVGLTAAGGQRFTATCRIRALVDASGKADGFTVAGMDVTQLRKTEQHLRSQCAEISERLAECETRLSAAAAACEESEAQKNGLTDSLQKLEEKLAARNEEFAAVRAGNEKQVAELTETIQTLETGKAEVEEKLEACRRQLEEDAEKYKELDQKRQQSLDELQAEKEQLESDAAGRISELEETLRQLQDREKKLNAERDRLNTGLSQAKEQLEARTGELKTERSEWAAEMKRLTGLQRDLEKTAKEKDLQLNQLTAERDGLESELQEARKKLEAGQKHVQLQVKQSTAAQRKELKQLLTDKKRLTAALEKSEVRLEKLNQTLREKDKELAAVAGAHKMEVQTLRKNRQELKTLLQREKTKLTALQKQMQKEQVEKQGAEDAWKKQRQELLSKTSDLEELLRDRTHELTHATFAWREKEHAFREERRELQERIEEEKEKQARVLDEAGCTTAEFRKERESWKQNRQSLQAQVQQLEELADERAEQLDQVTAHRVKLEEQLSQALREVAITRDSVDQQIEQKTGELKQQLKAQLDQEDKLKNEQKVLSDRLSKVQNALDERIREVELMQKARNDLEKQVADEKENLIQRIRLFKADAEEAAKNEAAWSNREAELMETVSTIEEKLAQKNQDLEQAAKERKNMAQDIDRLREIAGEGQQRLLQLTEDLEGPLAPVLKLSEAILLEEDLPEEKRISLGEIQRSAQRLQGILSYRRELIRLEDGTVCAEPEWFDLGGFIEEITESFNQQAEAGRLFFTFSRKGSLSGKCRADHAKIRQVLEALFERAVARTQKGQVGLHAMNESVGEERANLSFMLLYNGLGDDSVLIDALSASPAADQAGARLTVEEMELNVLCRKVRLMGGTLLIDNPTGRKPLLHFVLPVEQDAASQTKPDEKTAVFEKKAIGA